MRSDQLVAVLRASLRKALSGNAVDIPAPGRLVWQLFLDLCRTRSSNGYGPNALTYAEIEAYARLYRWPLEPRHVDMILALDREWMNHARGGSAGAAPAHSQPMTADAFDAVFS